MHVELLEEDCKSNTSIEATFKTFMELLVFFCTTTPVGMPLRTVLFFPPSESYGKKDSLQSRTIREMDAQGLNKDLISIVELFPYVFCYAMLC